MSGESQRRWRLWTGSQRGVLIAFVLTLSALVLWRLYWRPMYVSDAVSLQGARYDHLDDRIDPNSADWQTLALLPQIGEKRAKEIVAYREEYLRTYHGRLAFPRAQDLQNVKGIGPATVENLRPYLIFPEDDVAP